MRPRAYKPGQDAVKLCSLKKKKFKLYSAENFFSRCQCSTTGAMSIREYASQENKKVLFSHLFTFD